MWCNVAQIVSQIALILFFGKQGILVMVEVYTIFNILYLAVWHWQAQRVLNLHVTEILKDILPFMLIALLVMAATYFVTLLIANPILLLIARIVIAAVLYFMVMKLAGAEIMKECMQFMLKKRKH